MRMFAVPMSPRVLIQGLLLPLLLACGPGAREGEGGAEDAPRADRPADPPTDGKGDPVHTNRLAGERSPYLRQHAHNPVDWCPWGEEALARAQREDRPVLLSVGYAACHWCHVMEEESFEDEATGKLLSETFVCVKVDREERPDVDRLYMTAVQLMHGRGGWPMTVLLTPEGDPFWAGTYLPRQALHELTRRVATLWQSDRGRIAQQARVVSERLREVAAGLEAPPFEGSDEDLLRILDGALASSFDPRHGGYGHRPKFPPHVEMLLLLDRALRPGGRGDPGDLDQVRRTLDAVADGGIHDHVGGGFHRYSTDERWLLPHFEKMLYDNALLAQAYAGAHAATGEERYAAVARAVLDWIRREMARPEGGYASSLDADTEGEEGLTYTWTLDEVRAALPEEEARLAARVFGLTAEGNFDDERTGQRTGRNVIHLPRPLGEVARETGLSPGDLARRVEAIRGKLLAARLHRAQPGLDEKVIVSWNGLLLSAFARVGRDLGDEAALEEGRRLATFLLARCRREDGSLLRFPRESGPEIPGFCEDHVHLAEGLLDLGEATGEEAWTRAAQDLAGRLIDGFEDREGGGFWTTSTAHEALVARTKEAHDTPIPSDNGTAARLLLRLAKATGEARFREAADRTLSTWRPAMGQPRAATGLTALFRALAWRMEHGGAAASTQAAADASARTDLVEADAFLDRLEAPPGSRVRVAVRVRVAPGWHVNPTAPSEPDLVPSVLELAEGAPARLEDVAWPEPEAAPPGEGRAPLPLHQDTFWIHGSLVLPEGVPSGPRRIPLRLRVQPCSGTACQAPVTLELDLRLRYGAEGVGPARHAEVFAPSAAR